MTVRIEHGDSRDVVKTLADGSVDAVCTDPPYGIEFMGRAWDAANTTAFDPAFWAGILRVLKPGGYLAAFGGCRTYHRLACAIEDAGFITHPFVAWVFATGFPKATRVKADGWEGFRYGTQSLKPAIEPIYIGQKPFSKGLNGTANVLQHGTGALNIDGCRVSLLAGQRPNGDDAWADEPNLCYSCAERAANITRHGTPETRASIVAKLADLISSARAKTSRHATDRPDIGCSDGMRAGSIGISSSTAECGSENAVLFPEDTTSTTSTATRETTARKTCCACRVSITPESTANITRETSSLLRNARALGHTGRDGEPSAQRRYSEAGSTNFAATPGPRGGAADGRWPANFVHDGSEEVLQAFAQFGERSSGSFNGNRESGKFGGVYGEFKGAKGERPYEGNSGSAARFFFSAKADADDRCDSKHPTVKPVALMRWLARLITPPGGTVLDPFAGSGTTGVACIREGFDAILIEREAEYVRDIRHRLDKLSGLDAPLFAQAAE